MWRCAARRLLARARRKGAPRAEHRADDAGRATPPDQVRRHEIHAGDVAQQDAPATIAQSERLTVATAFGSGEALHFAPRAALPDARRDTRLLDDQVRRRDAPEPGAEKDAPAQ